MKESKAFVDNNTIMNNNKLKVFENGLPICRT